MEIIISGKHTLVTRAMEDYARGKVEKLDKFFDGITTARVILKVEDNRKTAELILSVAGGGQIATVAEGKDMYAALDKAVRRMKENLKKHKAKLRRRHDTTIKAMIANRAGRGGMGVGERIDEEDEEEEEGEEE
ncbi:MAG: ribosome-associated translation inhibitor RaiA [Planctomycetota bacterium]|nr:ribosome-associated translation inhibitor RaiA [Planctomycetota bacterium]